MKIKNNIQKIKLQMSVRKDMKTQELYFIVKLIEELAMRSEPSQAEIVGKILARLKLKLKNLFEIKAVE